MSVILNFNTALSFNCIKDLSSIIRHSNNYKSYKRIFGTQTDTWILCAELVPKLCLKWSFLGLISVLNRKDKTRKKPQN